MADYPYIVTRRPSLYDPTITDFAIVVEVGDRHPVEAYLELRHDGREYKPRVNWASIGAVESSFAREYAQAIAFAADLVERLARGETVPDSEAA